MKEFLLQAMIPFLTATLGTLGFALLFSVPKRHLAFAVLGGSMAILAYLGATLIWTDLFLCNMMAMMVSATYAEIMARVTKCPVTLYLIPSIVPLVPGGGLYYTMFYLVDGNKEAAMIMGEKTLLTALGISVGILIISIVTQFIYALKKA
ncbi:MAG TPA: threonine/serine exporter [Clostridiales bacterium]|nr:threonine/serine exporter [Clostridiales bacterium]